MILDLFVVVDFFLHVWHENSEKELKYTTYACDGDSKSYRIVSEADPPL